jgi:phospho-N-acetylmuramoyl-pentapeptide-transferase
MLYYLFRYLHEHYHIPGIGVFQYTTFRAALAVVTSLLIAQIFGGKLIKVLQRKQLGETIRDLGLQGQSEKKGTPTMGGLIICSAAQYLHYSDAAQHGLARADWVSG